ncbi:MAG: Fic family protein [Patescibacteria group bacterium]|nr:Fic family protein [Patescibacteria group bacterium]
MVIPPKYKLTNQIQKVLIKIESLKLFLNESDIPPQAKNRATKLGLLKSSLYSAKIEGNLLDIETAQYSRSKKKEDVFNILEAIKYIEKNIKRNTPVTKKAILDLHKIVMGREYTDVGKLRTQMEAIYNQFGQVVYIAPHPEEMENLVKKLTEYANKNDEHPLLKALITHLIFEKIHPFADGSGRVGRLLIHTILKSRGYNFGFLVPFEEQLNIKREEYYHALDIGLKNPERYLLFMLNNFYIQLKKTKEDIFEEAKKEKNVLTLTFRQEEIYKILKEHKFADFNFIKRRFLKVPDRTLRYDIKKLCDKNMIIKTGSTRGVIYKILD